MIELVLLLAQTCVAEIDLQNDPRECVEMWAINEAHAERRNITLAEQTRQYNAFWRRAAARRGRAVAVGSGELRAVPRQLGGSRPHGGFLLRSGLGRGQLGRDGRAP